jgi:hypothetical protein
MLKSKNSACTVTAIHDQMERLELANRLFREFHGLCFWHCPRDLVVTQDMIPLVVKGLRTHGGRRGFMLAGQLQSIDTFSAALDKGSPECR